MTIAKKLLISLLALLLVAVIAIAAVIFFVDPNHYRDRIETLARNSANIELAINGNLSWTLFPWLGISVTDTQISAINDTENPVASVAELSLSLKLIPLIKGNIEIDELHVDGLDLTLLTYADGRKNIDRFFQKKSTAQDDVKNNNTRSIESNQDIAVQQIPNEHRRLDIRAITFKNSQFHFEDQIKSLTISGKNIDFIVEEIMAEAPLFKIKQAHFHQGDITYLDANNNQEYAYKGIDLSLDQLLVDQNEDQNLSLSFDRFKLNQGTLTSHNQQSGKKLSIKPNAITSGAFHFSTFINSREDRNMNIENLSIEERGIENKIVENKKADNIKVNNINAQNIKMNAPSWSLDALKIDDLAIFYKASKDVPSQQFTALNFSAKNIQPQSVSPIAFSGMMHESSDNIAGEIRGNMILKLNLPHHDIRLSEMDITLLMTKIPSLMPVKPISLLLSGDIAINSAKETLHWSMPGLRLNQINLLESFKIEGFSPEKMRIEAASNLRDINLKTLLSEIGMKTPEFSDPQALTHISFQSPIIFAQNSVSLSPFHLIVDHSTFNGDLHILDLKRHIGALIITGDQLNLNHYRRAENKTPVDEPSQQKVTRDIEKKMEVTDDETHSLSMPLDMNFDLKATLKTLVFGNLTANNIDLIASINHESISIDQLNAGILGGSMLFKGAINNLSAVPTFKGSLNIRALPLHNIFSLLKKEIPLRGDLNLSGDFSTKGLENALIMRHLSGNIRTNISNGELIGVNYPELACEGFSLLKRDSFKRNNAPKSTRFKTLSGNATIQNGIIHNNNLKIEIQGLSANGAGSINLNKETLDYRINLKSQDSGIPNCKIDQYLKNIAIPLRCQGSFVNTGSTLCGIDQDAIGKMIADVAKKKIEATLKDKLQEVFPPIIQKPKRNDEIRAKDVIKAFEGLFR